jgi:NodT family efflux transporter outer membrane factor (OMF) lipoprotein
MFQCETCGNRPCPVFQNTFAELAQRTRSDTGIDDYISVVQARTTLQSAQAAAIKVGVARAQYEHAIAVLLGKLATDFSLPVKPLLTAPPPIPVGVPSQLLERRPDIAAAERTLAKDNAIIGIGYGAFFPSVSLNASGGFESSRFGNWFSWPSRFFSISPSISHTIFNGGLYRAELHQYTAVYNADLAAYRQTVLTAFQQVEDHLASVRIYSQEIQRQQEAVKSSQEYLVLATSRYQTGIDPYLNVLTAQTTVLSNQQTLVTLQINQMVSAVNLVEALGGGWDLSRLPTPSQVSQKALPSDYKVQRYQSWHNRGPRLIRETDRISEARRDRCASCPRSSARPRCHQDHTKRMAREDSDGKGIPERLHSS